MDRARLARLLLQNQPLIDEIFQTLRADMAERWEVAETVEAREDLHRLLRMNTQFAETLNVRLRELAGDGGEPESGE